MKYFVYFVRFGRKALPNVGFKKKNISKLHYFSIIIDPQFIMFHLVEAKEVLDGGGGVEDVAFSRHHQHEAVQRLKTKKSLRHTQ